MPGAQVWAEPWWWAGTHPSLSPGQSGLQVSPSVHKLQQTALSKWGPQTMPPQTGSLSIPPKAGPLTVQSRPSPSRAEGTWLPCKALRCAVVGQTARPAWVCRGDPVGAVGLGRGGHRASESSLAGRSHCTLKMPQMLLASVYTGLAQAQRPFREQA